MKFGYLLILMLCVSTLFGTKPLVVNENYKGYIGTSMSYYIDPSGSLDFENVFKLYESDRFVPNDEPIYAQSSPIPVYWFTFELKSEIDKEVWINVNNSNLSKIEFYKLSADNTILSHTTSGSTYPDSTRFHDCYTFWYPVVEAKDTNTYRYFIAATASLTMEMPVELGTFQELSLRERTSDYFTLFFMGAMIIMFLYNVVIFFFTRDNVYGYYSFCILGIIFGTTFLNNYPLLEEIVGKTITHEYTAAWLWTNLIGIGMFAIEYLKIKKRYPSLYKVILFELSLFLLYAVLNLFIPVKFLSTSFQILVVVFYLTCLYTAYYFVIKLRDSRAVLYSVGWSFVMLGGFIFLLVINGFVRYTVVSRNIMYLGVLIEVLLFSIALASSLNKLKEKHLKLNLILEQANQSLKQNNESLDSFNYHVSHDLKTVLNNSRGLARMIEKYNLKKDHTKIAEITEKLKVVTRNGAETVHSFLTLGKINSIFQNENATYIDVETELRGVVENHNLKDEIEVIVLKNEVGQMPFHYKAFESLFLNLFTNSIKYNNRMPKAEIQFFNEAKNWIVFYKDNGVGIDLEAHGERLFGLFHRGDYSDETEGTGIGLFTVKKIVENYGGVIDVESELGKGTLFIMRFPKPRD